MVPASRTSPRTGCGCGTWTGWSRAPSPTSRTPGRSRGHPTHASSSTPTTGSCGRYPPTADGGRPTAICEIPATGSIIGGAWGASGTIAFSVWRDNLYEVAASGGEPKPLVEIDPATQIDFHFPSWLPDGELMYVTHWKGESGGTGEGKPGLTIFDGKRQTGIPGPFGDSDDSPVYSPAGDLMYLSRGATPGVWTVPFDLKGRRATGTPALVGPDAVTLSASSDGSLLYAEGSNLNVPRQMVWLDRTGKVIETVGSRHVGLNRPSLSPDGRRVAFSAADNGNHDVWVLDLITGTETRLTFSPLDEFDPEWLGSSSRLAYVERSEMEGRVLSINADGTGGGSGSWPPWTAWDGHREM